MLAEPRFRCGNLRDSGQICSPARPRFGEMQVGIVPSPGPPMLFSVTLACQEIVLSHSFRYQLLQYTAPQNKTHSVDRIVRIETLLQMINSVPVAKSTLCCNWLPVQREEP